MPKYSWGPVIIETRCIEEVHCPSVCWMWCGAVVVQVTGIVRDATDTERYLLTGTWDERLEAVKVLDISKSSQQHNVVYNTSSPIVLWQRQYPPYVYSLSVLSLQAFVLFN